MKSFNSLRGLFGRARVRLGLGLALTLVTLYLALREVNLAEVWAALVRADGGRVGLAVGVVALNNIVKALRWQVLMGAQRRLVSFPTLLRAHLMGQALNILVPLRVGEVVRVYVVGGAGPGRSFTAGTVVLEKVVDLVCYTLLFFCSCFGSRCRSGPASPRGR